MAQRPEARWHPQGASKGPAHAAAGAVRAPRVLGGRGAQRLHRRDIDLQLSGLAPDGRERQVTLRLRIEAVEEEDA